MISFLRGIIFDVGQNDVIVEVGGVGYQVFVHPRDSALLKKGDVTFLYTHYVVREDLAQLFGFLAPEGQSLFKTLISANGIGPKTALAITGEMSYKDFLSAVFRDDVSALVRLPGIGKKTAQKLILELKDKLVQAGDSRFGTGMTGNVPEIEEAREALHGLGFAASEVDDLLREALKEKGSNSGSDVLVKHVLQRLGGGG